LSPIAQERLYAPSESGVVKKPHWARPEACDAFVPRSVALRLKFARTGNASGFASGLSLARTFAPGEIDSIGRRSFAVATSVPAGKLVHGNIIVDSMLSASERISRSARRASCPPPRAAPLRVAEIAAPAPAVTPPMTPPISADSRISF
jgi:hypothetical protein